ncbi:hypothetical protein JW906_02355 [bacterium]|nr:hypothetical protein [bacterium]
MNESVEFDLAIAYDWEYDQDFVERLGNLAGREGLKVWIIDTRNLRETLRGVEEKKLTFHCLLDRASDTHPDFYRLQAACASSGTEIIEPLSRLAWASDKATMHLEFISQGLLTPYTIILPPFQSAADIQLSLADLALLGRPFIIKPANTTGGGIGVVDGAETLQDVLRARQEFRSDKYLLQEKVLPLERDGLRFWFRGFFAFGLIRCAWWDDRTHRYRIVESGEMSRYRLESLEAVIRKIASICRLRFFSTEIARMSDGRDIVIDYVNESCDMRLESRHPDGVPDRLVEDLSGWIIHAIRELLENRPEVREGRS